MKGFYNRILKIDLTARTFEIEKTDDEIFANYLGGKGFASYLLTELNPPGVDPLGPDNNLIFTTGPVAGSSLWGSTRYGVFTKSPQTGFYSESYSGGRTPQAIDATGFDAIVIRGKSDAPTVVSIFPEGIDFHDAGDLWGMDTYETEDEVIRRYKRSDAGEEKCGAVVIGPAGENQVRFAVIENDYWRSAGRTGVGAVMGSKQLKALVFQGDRKRELYDQENVRNFSKAVARDSKDNPGVNAYKTLGTPMMVKLVNLAGAFPTRYWSEGQYAKWENISADALNEQCDVKPHACPRCLMACSRNTTILKGRHAGLKLEGPEYETIYAFGGLCLIDDLAEIAYLNDICDRLGMDTISAGNLCAFTMEAAGRGKLDYKIEYGDADAAADLLGKIARREGIGDILARGIKVAAREWGLEDIAVHVKGMEPAGYDPRSLKGMGLAYATSDRGACHLRATFYKPELSGMIKPDQIEGKAELFLDFEDRLTLMDTFIFCRFYRDIYGWEELAQITQAVTGLEADKGSLQKAARDIADLVRRFNLREGLKPEDDRLPKVFHQQLGDSGKTLPEDEFEIMLQDYYRLHGWDEKGRLPVSQ